jgi:hypothetical protein
VVVGDVEACAEDGETEPSSVLHNHYQWWGTEVCSGGHGVAERGYYSASSVSVSMYIAIMLYCV